MDAVVRVDTNRSGPFQFQVGVDIPRIQSFLDRVSDAHHRFVSVPMLPDIATRLEKEVVVSSVFGTNTIEGGTLTEEETAAVLENGGNFKDEKQKRVLNIRRAYELVESVAADLLSKVGKGNASPPIPLKEFMIIDLHKIITDGLSHPRNLPGEYRNNKKGELTKVGDLDHGGVYVAPKCLADIQLLIRSFLEWINSDDICRLSPLIRGPLVHYYFEMIHPFWDGNGRVGRVLEALVLKCSGFKYAPFALSRFYLEHIDQYFTVFNTTRKATEKNEKYPNTAFVEFFLERMLEALNSLHDRVNAMVGILLYETKVHSLLAEKQINSRQYTIIYNLLNNANRDLAKLQTELWYKGLYEKRTRRTRDRDLRKLVDLKLIRIAPEKKIELLIPPKI
jgi:cell filamentation protein, protein adenylyltransferase